MTAEMVFDVARYEETALNKDLDPRDEKRLDEVLLILLRKGFEAREAGSLKGWH